MLRFRVLLIAGLMVAAACSAAVRPPGGMPGAPAAQAAVERFLQLAAEKDYSGMGWIFGTADGPVLRRDPLPEVEQRMYVLANLLEHDTYSIAGGTPVPGRVGGALTFQVTIRRGARTFQVPFIAVRGPQDRWFVEQLATEALTAGR